MENDPGAHKLEMELSRLTGLTLTGGVTDLEIKLSAYINKLIQDDFHSLVQLLYRVDVNESKLKELLKQHQDANAGDIIARLIIERQLQKIEAKEKYSQKRDIPDDEKW